MRRGLPVVPVLLSACLADVEGDAADECSDGVDNDQDGVTDCADPTCEAATVCVDGPDGDTGSADSRDSSGGGDSADPDTDVDTGDTGSSGDSGSGGDSGDSGGVGDTGDSGSVGDTGDSGPVGDSGAGDSGDSGSTGDSGSADSGDSGPAGDSGSGDSGTAGDSGAPSDACAPPDAWTGAIDPALYATTPFDPSYDAQLKVAASRCCHTSSFRYLVLDATVALVAGVRMVYLSDGLATLVADPGTSVSLAPGDRVSFAYDGVSGASVVPSTFWISADTAQWVVEPGGHPIQVRELGAAPLDHDDGFARITHAFGELAPRSNLDCGTDRSCFLFRHQGTQDRIRVPNDNVFGLDADYTGGLCAEIVAPVGRYAGLSGTATFLDIVQPGWMRVWPKP